MREWFPIAEIAGLPGVPNTVMAIHFRAKKGNWKSRKRDTGRGGGKEYHISSLPPETRAHLAAKYLSNSGTIQSSAAIITARTQRRAAKLTDIIGLSDKALAKMDARLQVLELIELFIANSGLTVDRSIEVFCDKFNVGDIQVEEDIQKILGMLSKPTVYRWRQALAKDGPAGLAPKKSRGRKNLIDSQECLREFVVAMLGEFPHISGKQVHRAMEARFYGHEGVDIPCRRAVERYIDDWKTANAQVFAAIRNPDDYKNRFMVAFGLASENVQRLNQRWEFDSTPADIMLLDGRHTILAVIDVYTRRPMLRVAPSSRAVDVAALTRRAILDWGVPEVAKIDNGQDYVSKHIKRVFATLDIRPEVCPPFSPWLKPHIESFFHTFSHDLLELMPGYIGHNVAERSAIEARMSFSDRLFKKDEIIDVKMTAEELQGFCDRWINDIYMHRQHSGLKGKTPWQMVANWDAPINRIFDERALDLLLAEAPGDGGYRTVGKKGIRVDNYLFIEPSLWEYMNQRVRVLYDPADFGRIFVFSEDGRFICRAECPEITGIDRRMVSIKAREMQSKAVQEGKRAIKAATRKVRTQDVVDEILDHASHKAGELHMFPHKAQPYMTDGLQASLDAVDAAAGESSPDHEPAETSETAEVVSEMELARRREEAEAEQRRFDNPSARLRWMLEQEYNRELSEDEQQWIRWFKANHTFEMYEQIKGFVELKMGKKAEPNNNQGVQ